MLTVNTILKAVKDVPVNRLEELYQFVHSLTFRGKKSDIMKKKILSFSGIFSDMDDKDYNDFVHQTKTTRTQLFGRNTEL